MQKYLSKNNWIIDNKSDVSDLFHISKEIWGMTTVLLVAALKLKKKIISFQINENELELNYLTRILNRLQSLNNNYMLNNSFINFT